ncbi:hypothetical protein J6590_071767 [Homalodisca vitripennis]|nr:hypothetical protein J6590_071767 [Homalodisca vitripennis]
MTKLRRQGAIVDGVVMKKLVRPNIFTEARSAPPHLYKWPNMTGRDRISLPPTTPHTTTTTPPNTTHHPPHNNQHPPNTPPPTQPTTGATEYLYRGRSPAHLYKWPNMTGRDRISLPRPSQPRHTYTSGRTDRARPNTLLRPSHPHTTTNNTTKHEAQPAPPHLYKWPNVTGMSDCQTKDQDLEDLRQNGNYESLYSTADERRHTQLY